LRDPHPNPISLEKEDHQSPLYHPHPHTMAPVALSSELTSPPGVPLKDSQTTASNKDTGISLDAEGASTPYSTTTNAVSQSSASNPSPSDTVANALPSAQAQPINESCFKTLLSASSPSLDTKAGATVFGSALSVVEAIAVKESESVWVYDDAREVGFGGNAIKWSSEEKGKGNVFQAQVREGAGLELAGYKKGKEGLLSVFTTTRSLGGLMRALEGVEGDLVINVATTVPGEELALRDSLFDAGVVAGLAGLEGWEVVFSSSGNVVASTAGVYAKKGKSINVIESTYSAREISSYKYPEITSQEGKRFDLRGNGQDIKVVLAGYHASTLGKDDTVLTLMSLSPDVNALHSALAVADGQEKKKLSVLGGTKADADALKAVLLATLYSASGSSKAVLPSVKSVVVTPTTAEASGKTITFYTAPFSPLPELVAHLFLSSPSLATRLGQYGSTSVRGLKSVLSIASSSAPSTSVTVDTKSDVVWVSDPNVLKSTDVLDSINDGGILVIELPYTEEEVPTKLTRSELTKIKEKHIRVFLLDLDPTSPSNPIKEQIAFLLLYTGSQKLPAGVHKVLNAFYAGDLGREDVEDAQAGLSELDVSDWEVPELEAGKTDKIKDKWTWDSLAGEAGVTPAEKEAQPELGVWDLAARHLLFREAFATDDKTVQDSFEGPGISALRPSTADKTYLATVTENRRLTPMTYDRNVFHIELSTAGTGLTYSVGEALGVHGWNDTAEVLEFCEWYGLDPDSLVSFPNASDPSTLETRTVFQLLQQNIDLFGRPGKAFYASLSKLATSKADAMTLKFISAPEGAELFKKMAEDETVTFVDVLWRFRTARPGIEVLVGLIPEIKPRHYSIASSQKAVGDKVELLVVTVDWVNSKGEWIMSYSFVDRS
jgi:sulfite reductase (NADPH) flavoprotein alpha-component